MQSKIVRQLADQGSCVFVGRCSDYVLKDRENHIKIFIYAPLESRIKVCMERFGMNEHQARMMTAVVDKARQAYHMTYTGYLPEAEKDMLVNSQKLGVEKTAEMLRDMIWQRLSE